MNIIYQTEFRPELSTIYGPKSYRDLKEKLISIDKLLIESGIEDEIIGLDLEKHQNFSPTDKQILLIRQMLRCNIIITLTNDNFRSLATRIADSELLKWFCCINVFNQRTTPSKSTLERYNKHFDEEQITKIVHLLNQFVVNKDENDINN